VGHDFYIFYKMEFSHSVWPEADTQHILKLFE